MSRPHPLHPRMTLPIFVRSLMRRLLTDNISFLAGGVAFYGLLALFPAIAALVSIFGLVAKASVINEQLEAAQAFFPPIVYKLLHDQVLSLINQPNTTLSITAVISLLITLFSATRGTKAMLSALNLVFRINENRPWWYLQLMAFFITAGGLLIFILALFILIAIPLLIGLLPPDLATMIGGPAGSLRWVILGGSILCGLILLFALGPNRPLREHRFSLILLGASVATFLWIIFAAAGTWFVTLIPSFHAAYGSLSAVTVLMVWIIASAYTVLIGAAVTATLEYPHIREATEEDEKATVIRP